MLRTKPHETAERAGRRKAEPEQPHTDSPTAVAIEALQTGVLAGALPTRGPEIPGIEGQRMHVGDPDVSALQNEYSGEDTPGATSPTPDQNQVDEIGSAYGLQEEDTGSLHSAAEILERRDRHRED
jgi:hypothetical protein